MIITVCSNNMGDNQLSQPKSRGAVLLSLLDFDCDNWLSLIRSCLWFRDTLCDHVTWNTQMTTLFSAYYATNMLNYARVAPRFWRYIFDAHLLLTWGHETEHCTCSIIVIMTPERLPAPNESILQWHVWLLCMLRLKLKVTFNILHRNGVARNIKEKYAL